RNLLLPVGVPRTGDPALRREDLSAHAWALGHELSVRPLHHAPAGLEATGRWHALYGLGAAERVGCIRLGLHHRPVLPGVLSGDRSLGPPSKRGKGVGPASGESRPHFHRAPLIREGPENSKLRSS